MHAGNDHWNLVFCAGFIVEPSKGVEQEEVKGLLKGSPINVNTIPRDFFLPLFSKSADDYPIEVAFVSEGEVQQNEVRGLIRSVTFGGTHQKEDAVKQLAVRLALVTDQRSHAGLFIVLAGKKDDIHRVLLWKFPADETLQAAMVEGGITIKLIEDAFSRRSTYFKAAMFEGPVAVRSFWKGKVEDNQAKHGVKEAAEFWIVDFLATRPSFTDAHGTRVVSKAIRKVINRTKDVETKENLIAAARVIKTQSDHNVSVNDLATRYLPPETRDDFVEAAGGADIAEEIFRLDPETMEKELKFKSITVDGKFLVRGPLDEFDEVVRVGQADEQGIVQVSLRGRITSESIKTR